MNNVTCAFLEAMQKDSLNGNKDGGRTSSSSTKVLSSENSYTMHFYGTTSTMTNVKESITSGVHFYTMGIALVTIGTALIAIRGVVVTIMHHRNTKTMGTNLNDAFIYDKGYGGEVA